MAHGQDCSISDELLELYVLERLETGQTVEFEDHLLLCSSCQDRVEEMAEHVVALQFALREIETDGSAPWIEACTHTRTAPLEGKAISAAQACSQG